MLLNTQHKYLYILTLKKICYFLLSFSIFSISFNYDTRVKVPDVGDTVS